MGLISDFLSGENKRREEAAKKAVGIDEDYERRIFLATHPNMESEDESDDDYEEEIEDEDDFVDEFDDENNDIDEEDDDDEEKMSGIEIICGAIIGAKILRRGEELGLVNLDNL